MILFVLLLLFSHGVALFLWLVWTPCLMHRCVCVFDYTCYKITTTNYIFKTSLYIPHFACIHRDCGRWKSWCLHCLWPVR
jgi:hypothetical protein